MIDNDLNDYEREQLQQIAQMEAAEHLGNQQTGNNNISPPRRENNPSPQSSPGLTELVGLRGNANNNQGGVPQPDLN